MSVRTQSSSEKEPKGARATTGTSTAAFTELDEKELDGLIERIEEAKTHGLALSPDDYALLLSALMTLANLTERLNSNDLTIRKLKKLLGIVPSSEHLRALKAPESEASEDSEKKPSASERSKKGSRARSKSKTKAPAIKPTVHHHAMVGMSKGDHCPECHKGRVYKYSPSSLLRIVGHAPLSSQQHVCEQLRCNGCGEIFSADLPKAVRADGRLEQKYGFSARAVMAIAKYYGGQPFFRQESVNGILGGHVAASTVFDQCEKVADACYPIFKALKAMAANAPLLWIDDTTNRILNSQPIVKVRGGKERLRSGVYTSSCLARTEDGRSIVLFQTNIGHAGEWIEEILQGRDPGLDPPMIMSDALSANHSHAIPFLMCLCNSHARRGFFELADPHPDEVMFVLDRYKYIWIHESHCQKQGLSASDRLAYHKKHSLPYLEEIQTWCEEQIKSGQAEENSNLGQAIKYFLRHYEGLSAFCRLEGAPLDNNPIERLIKLIVRGRKNSLFFKTTVGADVSDVITSILATCSEHNINAFEYLIAVQQHSLNVKASPESWLPWNYPTK